MGPRILIIGAGAAGIATFTRLYENGFDNMVILEAENRIGGRIHTVPYGANVVDYGAQWVHSNVDNCVYDMAAKYNLVEIESHPENEICIKSNGVEIPIENSNLVLQVLTDSIKDVDRLKNYPKSLGDFYVDIFQESMKNGKFDGIDNETCYQLFDFFLKYHHTYNAVDSLFETSAAGLLEFTDHQDDYLINWKGRGFKTVIDLMLKRLPEQNSTPIPLQNFLVLNQRVININYPAEPDEKCTVTCADGNKYSADHVIITVSLGVLKENYPTLFTPKLPSMKINAISGLYIGTIDKMILEFEQPFWPSGWHGFGILWNKQDLEELRKSDYRWVETICAFFVPEYQPNLLVGWIYGEEARTMEMLPETRVIEGLLFVLRKFLTKFNVPNPKSFSRSTWYANENFRGSYTSRSVMADVLNAKAADLATPLVNTLGKPVVQFAGEASHPEYYSTVQGAIGSGWREADRLIELYRDKRTTIQFSKL
ncbi:spermine oxidase-like [Uranotaenia lowii]|uniref:spermine oxidase-like n=1 Tax=Uranotaenia lowii TaxID=190385 RepID=UPI002478FD50|nr:spermine oxidase-like [Uranotaenia lowii]